MDPDGDWTSDAVSLIEVFPDAGDTMLDDFFFFFFFFFFCCFSFFFFLLLFFFNIQLPDGPFLIVSCLSQMSQMRDTLLDPNGDWKIQMQFPF